MVDLDIGDMFLNTRIYELISYYVRVDLTPFYQEEMGKDMYVIW